MALNPNEIKKINDLYAEIDVKNVEIASLKTNLTTLNTSFGYLSSVIENNKKMIEDVTAKLEYIIQIITPDTKKSAK